MIGVTVTVKLQNKLAKDSIVMSLGLQRSWGKGKGSPALYATGEFRLDR